MSIPERLAESLLSNTRADRVKAVAGLARRSARSKHGLFLAEGPQNLREALMAHLADGTVASDDAAGAARSPEAVDPAVADMLPTLEAVYVTEALLQRHPDIADLVVQLLDGAGPHRVFVRLASDEVLKAMADSQSPQGAIAVCRIPEAPSPQFLGKARLVAVLCRVQDPGNAGTIIRAADAAGADAVVLTQGSVDLFNPKTVRSTAGSLFHLPVVVGVELEEISAALRPEGQILAADGYGSIDLDVLQDAAVLGQPTASDLRRPTTWLFGNEAQGLCDEEKALADHRVAVALYGRAESLNVGTAATLCLYASARAQRRAPSS